MTVTLAQGAGPKRARCYCVFTQRQVARTHAPLRRLVQVTGCRFDGPRRPTQAPYRRRDKYAHRGSPGGHVPLSSKGVYPCCRTWKVRAKLCPCQGNTCSRLAAFFLIACVLSFFMLLGKPKRMLPRFLMSWRNLGGKLCRLRCWGCHTTLLHGL